MIYVRQLLRDDFDLLMSINKYVSKAEIILNQFAIVTIDEEVEDRTILARVSEDLLEIKGINASFTIAYNKSNESVSISARSFNEVNVQIIMEELGGGGHLNSAATQITSKTVEEVNVLLQEILNREYETGDKSMKVILLEDIKGRGAKDQIIDVATGYGNFLLTNAKGVLATPENLEKLKKEQQALALRLEDEKKMMIKIKSEIEKNSVNVYIKVGQDGKSFGHITSKQVCEEFESQTGIRLDKRKVDLPIEINTLGVFSATIHLHKEVVAQLEINVLEK